MSVLDRAQALSAAGQRAAAVTLIEQAAAAADGEALFALANWRLYGLNGPRDPVAARELAVRAWNAGFAPARHLEAALVASGIGGAADPDRARALLATIDDPSAREQIALLDAMPPAAHVASPTVRRDDPSIVTLATLLSQAECAYLIARAGPQLRPSHIIGRDGRPTAHPFRTSAGMNFGPSLADPVVAALNRRMADASGTAVAAGEPLQVLRYRPGEEYRPHLDALPGEANQRDWTLLTMLRPPQSGGETRFDPLDLTITLGVGDALLFRNVTIDGLLDPRTRHAGLPVIVGEKWLATRWIRRHALPA